MPFNIEFSTKVNNTVVKLQVVENCINMYFNGNDANAILTRHSFSKLIDGYLDDDIQCNMVRGSDEPHVKRHHNHMGETGIMHTHYILSKNVDVNDLKKFLGAINVAQFVEASSKQYYSINMLGMTFIMERRRKSAVKFLQNKESEEILEKFEQYLKVYADSELEQQYRKDRVLNIGERLEIAAEILKAKKNGQTICPKDERLLGTLVVKRIYQEAAKHYSDTRNAPMISAIERAPATKPQPIQCSTNSIDNSRTAIASIPNTLTQASSFTESSATSMAELISSNAVKSPIVSSHIQQPVTEMTTENLLTISS